MGRGSLAREVERARRALQLSKVKYAALVGITRPTLYAIVLHDHAPSIDTLKALRDLGGCRAEVLFPRNPKGRAA